MPYPKLREMMGLPPSEDAGLLESVGEKIGQNIDESKKFIIPPSPAEVADRLKMENPEIAGPRLPVRPDLGEAYVNAIAGSLNPVGKAAKLAAPIVEEATTPVINIMKETAAPVIEEGARLVGKGAKAVKEAIAESKNVPEFTKIIERLVLHPTEKETILQQGKEAILKRNPKANIAPIEEAIARQKEKLLPVEPMNTPDGSMDKAMDAIRTANVNREQKLEGLQRLQNIAAEKGLYQENVLPKLTQKYNFALSDAERLAAQQEARRQMAIDEARQLYNKGEQPEKVKKYLADKLAKSKK